MGAERERDPYALIPSSVAGWGMHLVLHESDDDESASRLPRCIRWLACGLKRPSIGRVLREMGTERIQLVRHPKERALRLQRRRDAHHDSDGGRDVVPC